MTAMGFIETRGLVAAIEGADAMLKAANVRLLEKNCVGGGLVSITVAGEVAAVHAAVDAAVASIRGIRGAALISRHVIARPDTELCAIIATTDRQTGNLVDVPVAAPVVREELRPEQVRARHEISQLKTMNVSRLRQIARTLSEISLSRESIESARKKDLIEAIITAYRQEEE